MQEDPTGPDPDHGEVSAPPRATGGAPEPPESGLARSIRSLFPSRSSSIGSEIAAGTEDSQPAPERALPNPEPVASMAIRALRARFTTRVAAYLRASPDQREPLVPGILEDAGALRDDHELRAVADAVVVLALAGDDEADGSALALAAQLMDPGVTSHIAVRLGTDRDSAVRASLGRVARRLPALLAPSIAAALPESPDRGVQRALMDALVGLGEHGREAALALLQDPRWYAVRDGVILLSEIADDDTVNILTVPLAHGEPRVRRETLRALARIGGEDAGLLLVGKLDDPSPEVRAAAAMGVGELRVTRGLRPLLEHLVTEEADEVLVQVLEALGRLGDPGAVPAIEKRAVGSIFSRPDRRVRLAAYRALAAIGTPHARSVLEAAASDRDSEVREGVQEILGGGGGGPSEPTVDPGRERPGGPPTPSVEPAPEGSPEGVPDSRDSG